MSMPPSKVTTTAAWVSLVTSALVFVYIALTAPDTRIVGSGPGVEKAVREVRASTNVHYLQERAATLIQLGSFTGSLSLFLCRLALGALLIAMTSSGITIVKGRRMRKEWEEPKRSG